MSRALVFGGVAVACALGAGMGLWARPAPGESPNKAKPAQQAAETAAPLDRRLHIVVDDSPLAAPARPLEVAPAAPPVAHAVAPIVPEPQAPRRPPEGLVRVDAPIPGPLATAPAPAPVTRLREAPPPRRAPPPLRREHAERPAARHATRVAKAEPAKHARPRPREVERAQAAHEAPQEGRAHRAIAALEHAVRRIAVHERREQAREEPRREAPPKHERKPAVRQAKAVRAPEKPPKRERYVAPLNTKGAGPIRVATVVTRCASPDPGAALTCGDPALGAAERRMNRAYRDAEAAGVPRDRLEQQQQRWLSARAAAAREAPWAVREVYQARIAELQDMARAARGE